MDETDHGLTPRIADLKVNRKVNEINDLPTPPPRQCWLFVPSLIALKTRRPHQKLDILYGIELPWLSLVAFIAIAVSLSLFLRKTDK